MKNKLLPTTITFIFIIIFIVFYKGLKDTNIYTPETKINNEVPSLSVNLFDTSKTVNTIEIFKSDKFYLLNIWSSWCVPCREEHSILMELKNNDSLKVIGMNYKDNKDNA
jgi:cytochrome c biogenesis protein CcmG/thiol:disulfide interchange protein DsbE